MTKKRLQKIYNCVAMHNNLEFYDRMLIQGDDDCCKMLKNQRKVIFYNFEKWYKSYRIDWRESNRILNNQEIYEMYLEGTHCLYFNGDSTHILSEIKIK